MITLSDDQKPVHEAMVACLRGETGKLLKVGGFAGTGKTTIVSEAVLALGPNRPALAFCALSGKAASVLKSKLIAASALREDDYCGTIHGFVYALKGSRVKKTPFSIAADSVSVGGRQPVLEKIEMELHFESNGAASKAAAIVLDEASMCPGEAFADLSNLGLPILAIGDHGQLPPVRSDFNLMENPDLRLEKIHRQAEGNPIIALSRMAREDGKIPVGHYGPGVEKIRGSGDHAWAKERLDKSWVMLCGMNSTRVFWNNHLRYIYNFNHHDVVPGERVICLKNNKELGIFNGMMGTVLNVKEKGEHWYDLVAQMDGSEVFVGEVLKHQFGSQSTQFEYSRGAVYLNGQEVQNLFDWAWCVTVHKSQGSEFESVCLMEERFMRSDEDWRRFLYTAVTRAKKRLFIVGS